jgi:hypothetical protein
MSRVRFPVKAERHGGENDQPKTTPVYAIFDAGGLWANIAGIIFQMPAAEPGNAGIVEHVARMLNAAHEQGKEDAKAEIREALGIET